MKPTDSKHILITGAARGIGAAIAKTFSENGHRVSMLGRNLASLQETACELGSETSCYACDITDPVKVESAFAAAVENFGPVEVLVNNAGAASSAPFMKTSPDQFKSMIDVNYLGACYCIQQVLPTMLEHHGGRIVNIGSTSSVKGYAYVSAYSAAKHAIMGMTRSLAIELGSSGVTINTVCPGFTQTDIVRSAVTNIMQKTNRSEEQAIADITKHNPQGRLVQPEEVAQQVYYLAQHAPLSVNGQAIMLDGGETN